MNEEFSVRPLTCGNCGAELPVMGQFVTFQCRTCYHYYVLSPQGLRSITVHRAVPPDKPQEETIHLPLWVIAVDCAEFRTTIERIIDELRCVSREILQANFEAERPEPELIAMDDPQVDPGLFRARMLSEATRANRLPATGEIDHLIRRMSGSGSFSIYVPAFLSLNTYAYLKVGRLFTMRQPAYEIEKSRGLGSPVLCALQADEAVSLMDFIFFAALPESLRNNTDLLKRIRLRPAASARLVEFPFARRGAYLVSLIGGFWISCRLVEGLRDQPEGHCTSSMPHQRSTHRN